MVDALIPFSRPFRSAAESSNLEAVLQSGHAHGDGPFTASASGRLKGITDATHVLLTSSGTHALEMASLLLDLGPGDEVILPSFTFPSGATAIALTGAVPVFVDIDPGTGNIDPELITQALTPRTKAISVMHYGGVAVEMEKVMSVASEHGLPVIEDNAHGLGGVWRDRKLGTIGSLGAQSFHDTKNVHSGEGGALLVNDAELSERAEMIREKGTNRSRFLRGQVDKYTWTDIGSSYLMSELNAAVLDSQLAEFSSIQDRRMRVWSRYSSELTEWAEDNAVRLMSASPEVPHTAHLFYMIMPSHDMQAALLAHLRERGIIATFHYIPLDTSPAGMRFGRTPFDCRQSADFSSRLVRLPLWAGMSEDEVAMVVDAVAEFTTQAGG